MQRLADWQVQRAREVITVEAQREGAALPILHALQGVFGYIPDETIPLMAETLNISRAEMFGIIGFYHDFRREPAGKRVLRLCRAEACQAMGGNELAGHVKQRLGIDWHGTTQDGSVTLEPVYCLGLCATAPAASIGAEIFGRLTPARLDAALEGAA